MSEDILIKNYQWDLENTPLCITGVVCAMFNIKDGGKVDIKNVSFNDLINLKTYMDIYFHVGELNNYVQKSQT